MLTPEEYHAVYMAAPDGCLVVDEGGTIQDVNPKAESLFGWSRAELIGQRVEALVPEASRSVHAEHRAKYVASPHDRPMGIGLSLLGRRRDGSTFPVEIGLSTWVSGPGRRRVICAVRDVTEYKRLQDFSEGALRASEEERARIARELHDDTAQRLATLLLRVRMLAEEPDAAVRGNLLEQIRGEIVEAANGVKRISRGLRPPELEEVGLALAIQAHLRGLLEGARFRVEAELDSVDAHLGITARLALYRIVQEALSNARRHSGSDRARVRLALEDGSVVAEVEDEGSGFRFSNAGDPSRGLGLVGMQERATMVGGRLTIESKPGRGTRVRVTVPVSNPEAPRG